MKSRKNLLASLTLGTAMIAGGATADVIYSQNFDTPDTTTTNGDALGVYSWAVHAGGAGGNSILHASNDWDNPVTSVATQARVVNDAGAPSTSDRIFTFWGNGNQDLLFWTEDFTPIAQSGYNDLTIAWSQRDDAGNGQRATVAIDTGSGVQWYAADVKTATSWTSQSSLLASSIWVPFSFDGTQTTNASAGFNVSGTAGALADGNIVAVGLYLEMLDEKGSRFDSFALTGTPIPEPASLALMSLGGLMILGGRRRQA